MNTDAVLVEDSIINKYLAKLMTTMFAIIINPYFKVKECINHLNK